MLHRNVWIYVQVHTALQHFSAEDGDSTFLRNEVRKVLQLRGPKSTCGPYFDDDLDYVFMLAGRRMDRQRSQGIIDYGQVSLEAPST
jgi:hypothetical protein